MIPMPFPQALKGTEVKKCHVLLGNGFSRALLDTTFAYNALFDRAKGRLSVTAKKAFDALGTTNFELVMKALRDSRKLASIYSSSSSSSASKAMAKDAEEIREALAATIAESHPDRPSDITESQYMFCRKFLSHFGSIYTVNYDLLLYWTQMQAKITPHLTHDDGFRTPSDGGAEYVTWEVQNTDAQNTHYLHGGLHLFDAGHELQKYTWVNTNRPLIEQIREALAADLFPLFVSEGTSNEKLDRIQHSNYLGRSYRSFSKIAGTLFIFGLSLAENDEHLLRLLDRGRMSRIMIGVFGDPSANWNRPMIERALLIQNNRKKSHPVTVGFFDAASAEVWGKVA